MNNENARYKPEVEWVNAEGKYSAALQDLEIGWYVKDGGDVWTSLHDTPEEALAAAYNKIAQLTNSKPLSPKVTYTVFIPWTPRAFRTPWHPEVDTGPLSGLQRGSFPTMEQAIVWAKEHLNGTPYEVRKVVF